MKKGAPILRGKDAIKDFLGMSTTTLDALIQEGFPIAQIGGIYYSTETLIVAWFESKILARERVRGPERPPKRRKIDW